MPRTSTRYKIALDNDDWDAKANSELIALHTQVKRLEAKTKTLEEKQKSTRRPPDDTTKGTGPKTKKRTETEKDDSVRRRPKYLKAWQTVAPKPGDPEVKTIKIKGEDTPLWWCGDHPNLWDGSKGRWVNHKPEDCTLSKRTKDTAKTDKPEKAPTKSKDSKNRNADGVTIQAAHAALSVGIDDSESESDEE